MKPCKNRKKLLTSLAAGFVSFGVLFGGYFGLNRYKTYQNEYVYNEKAHISAPRHCSLEEISNESTANSELVNFPTEIPGASNVNKYVTPGAKYCLVHVRQAHLSVPDDEIDKEDPKIIQETKDINEKLYSIFSFLYTRYNLSGKLTVFNEGEYNIKIPSFEETISNLRDLDNQREEYFKQFKNNYNGVVWFPDQIQKEFDTLFDNSKEGKSRKSLQKIKEYYTESEILRKKSIYALDKLHIEEKVDIRGFERPKEHDTAMFFLDKGYLSPKFTFNNREDSFLEDRSQADDSLIFLVLGADHAFSGKKAFGKTYKSLGRDFFNRDNIYEWNQKHPYKKFSLIEVTPIGYFDKE